MPKTGLILPRGRATQYPLFVARAESYWRDRGLVFGADYSAGNRRDLVTGALPTATSTIGGNTALGPGAKTDGTRTGFVYATPPGLPTTLVGVTIVLVVTPLNINTGTLLYLAAMGPAGDPAMSITMDTTNLRYGILENAFTWTPNNSLVIGQTNVVVALRNGSTHTVYIDGVQSVTDANGGGTRTAAALGIGRQGSNASSNASAVISAAMVFNRALSASEAADLTMRLRQQAPSRFRPLYVGPSSAGGGAVLTAAANGVATVATTLGRKKGITVATINGTSTVAISLGRLKGITAPAIAGVAAATVTLGRIKAITLTTVVGLGTASVALGRLKAATIAAVSGNSTVAATLHAIRSVLASAAGASTVTVTLAKLAQHALTVPAIAGQSTVTTTLTAKRSISALVAGVATVNVALGRRGFATLAAVIGSATVAVTIVAIRSITATVHGIASVVASLGRFKAAAASSQGTSTASVTLHARRSITVTVNAGSTVNLTANARRVIAVNVAGRAGVSVSPDRTSGAVGVLTGKYRREHDGALSDLAGATGFATEHTSALRDISDAGV